MTKPKPSELFNKPSQAYLEAVSGEEEETIKGLSNKSRKIVKKALIEKYYSK